MRTHLTKKEACQKIANAIRDAYISGGSTRTIGFNANGYIDWDHTCHNHCCVVFEAYNTEEWTLGDFDEFSEADENSWTDEFVKWIATCFEQSWLDDLLQKSEYEIEFADLGNLD